MISNRILFATVSALALAAGALPARADEPTGDLRGAYAALRDGGCDVAKLGSPLAARVLRNVPYALGGKIFKSPELTRVFGQDGDWYQPATSKDPKLSAADRSCVRALTAHEQKLRKKQKKIPAGIEVAVTGDRAAMLLMIQNVGPDLPQVRTRIDRDGAQTEYTLSFETPPGEFESAIVFTCNLPTSEARKKVPDWSKVSCTMMAAG